MSHAVSIPYSFYGGNREAILCRDPEVMLVGPRETGKTLAWLWKLHTLAYKPEYAGCQISILRKVKADIVGSVYRTLKRDLLDPYGPGTRVYGGEYPQFIDYPTSSRVWIGGMDDPGKTLSAERDFIYFNQAEEASLVDWEYLTSCVTGRGAVMPYTQLVGDCNPASPSHWIKQRAKSGVLTFFESHHEDNPTLWDHEREDWTEQGVRSLERLGNLTGARKLRLFHGLWASPEGAIYDVFEDEYGKHKVKSFPIPHHWPRAVGIDPAGAYRAAIWLAFDPESQVLNVYRETLEPFGSTVARFAEQLRKSAQGEPVFVWVCGAKSERDWRTEFENAGLPVLPPPISDVWIGIDKVYELLRDFKLVVHDTCTNLLSEIGEYSRKQNRKTGEFVDTIENKDKYHCLDALRYVTLWLATPAEMTQVTYNPVRIGSY